MKAAAVSALVCLAMWAPAEALPCQARYEPTALTSGYEVGAAYDAIKSRIPKAAGCDPAPGNTDCVFWDSHGYMYVIQDPGPDGETADKTTLVRPGVKLPLGLQPGDGRKDVVAKLRRLGLTRRDFVNDDPKFIRTDFCFLKRRRDDVFAFRFEFSPDGRLTRVDQEVNRQW